MSVIKELGLTSEKLDIVIVSAVSELHHDSNTMSFIHNENYTIRLSGLDCKTVRVSSNQCRQKFDITDIGDTVREFYASELIDIVGIFPPNIISISCNSSNSLIFGDDSTLLETLCLKHVSSDFILPPNLRMLVCDTPPDILPEYLTHLSCNKINHSLKFSDNLDHMCCFSSEQFHLPPNLKFLKINCDNPIFESDMDDICPDLESLSIIFDSNNTYGSYENTYSDFSKNSLFKCTDAVPKAFSGYWEKKLPVFNLPSSIKELYVSPEIKAGCDFQHLAFLEKLHCSSELSILPKSVRCLVLDISKASIIWTDEFAIKRFLYQMENVERLGIPYLSEPMYR